MCFSSWKKKKKWLKIKVGDSVRFVLKRKFTICNVCWEFVSRAFCAIIKGTDRAFDFDSLNIEIYADSAVVKCVRYRATNCVYVGNVRMCARSKNKCAIEHRNSEFQFSKTPTRRHQILRKTDLNLNRESFVFVYFEIGFSVLFFMNDRFMSRKYWKCAKITKTAYTYFSLSYIEFTSWKIHIFSCKNRCCLLLVCTINCEPANQIISTSFMVICDFSSPFNRQKSK